MSHGPVCPCPNCRTGSGGFWLLLILACAVVAVGCYFAAKAAVAWLAAHVLIDALAGWLLVLAGFGVAYKARQRARTREMAGGGDLREQQQQLRHAGREHRA